MHREWPYKNVEPRIIIEKYINSESATGLRDYKFFVFNGTTQFIYISEGLEDYSTAKNSFLDVDGNLMPFHRTDFMEFNETPKLPGNFDEMLVISNCLGKKVGCPFVRIDLYSVNEKIYFLEITFTPCAGFMPIEPEIWNEKLGNMINIVE